MFKKTSTISQRNYLGGKERRRIRQLLSEQFPSCPKEQLDFVLPASHTDDFEAAKMQNSRVVVYYIKGLPIIFDIDGRGTSIFPTVYALWLAPQIVSCFEIHSQTSDFILGGADVMLPGVIVPPEGYPSRLSLATIWGVRVRGCRFPFAVGRSTTSAAAVAAGNMKGKALEVLHCYGDNLWKSGSKLVPDPCFTLTRVFVSTCSNDSHTETTSTSPTTSSNTATTIPDSTTDVVSDCTTNHTCDTEEPYVQSAASTLTDTTTTATADVPRPSNTDDSAVTGMMSSGTSAATNYVESVCNAEDNAVAEAVGGPAGGVPETDEGNEEQILSSGSNSTVHFSSGEIDLLLEYCLLDALYNALADSQLPMDGSAVYSKALGVAPNVLKNMIVLSAFEEKFSTVAVDKIHEAVAVMPMSAIVDVQKSSHKKALKFVAWAAKSKWIDTKEQRGVTKVIKVNREHPRYKAYVTACATALTNKSQTAAGSSKSSAAPGSIKAVTSSSCVVAKVNGPKVQKYYRFMGRSRAMIVNLTGGPSPADYLGESEVDDVLRRYAVEVANPSNNPSAVGDGVAATADPISSTTNTATTAAAASGGGSTTAAAASGGGSTTAATGAGVVWLDGTLSTLLKKPSGSSISYREYLESVRPRLNAYYSITPADYDSSGKEEAPKVIGGTLAPVAVREAVKRGKNYVTTVEDHEQFYIDSKVLSECLSKRMASSSSVYALPGQKKQQGVSVQGKVGDGVVEVLQEEFGLERNLVSLLRTKKKVR
eukprot:Lankesteria_metandrocarpae@DN106_c0_g1_i1.p1